MSGKGLESLIPKKSQLNQTPPQDFRTSSQDGERSALFEKSVSEADPQGAPSGAGTVSDRSRTSEAESQAGERHAGARDPVFSRIKPTVQEAIFQIEVEKIKPNPYQPRRYFNEEELKDLAQSIQEFGILQPLIVTKIEKETPTGRTVEYELLAGERRLLAARLAGLERVPAVVKRFDLSRSKLEVALIENIQRSNLNPIDAARGYARLQEEFGLTQKEIALKIGKSRETVANTIRLLNLPGVVQEALMIGKINESQARLILVSSNPAEQKELFSNLIAGKNGPSGPKSIFPAIIDPEAQYWQGRLEEYLGAPVKVERRKGKGRLVVKFYSEVEWRNILDKFFGEEKV